jgi:hypothetical protein
MTSVLEYVIWDELHVDSGKIAGLEIEVNSLTATYLKGFKNLGCDLWVEEPLKGSNLLTFQIVYKGKVLIEATGADNAISARRVTEKMANTLTIQEVLQAHEDIELSDLEDAEGEIYQAA